jgi:hypothetical protein
MPRVMLLIGEQNLGSIPTSDVESIGTARLLARKIRVIDSELSRAAAGRTKELLRTAGDERGAAALGQQFGAEVVIVGEAVSKPSAQRIAESNLRSYQAVVTLKAVRTDNAAAIATASESAGVVALDDVSGGSKALKAAAAASFDALLPAMIEAWARDPASGAVGAAGSPVARLSLTVGGVDQLWKLKAVREQLRGLEPSVTGVTQRSYTSGVAEFEADSNLPAEELAEILVQKPPEGLRFQVLEIGAGRISLRAAPP